MTQWAANIDALGAPLLPEQAERRAAVVVALRARDSEDEALLLDALGLNRRQMAVSLGGNPYPDTADYTHGRRSGVEHHLAAGHALCRACARWAWVQARKTGAPPPAPASGRKAPTVRDSCGTQAGYRAHYRRGESPCAACREANSVACRGYADKRWRGQGGGAAS